MATKQKIIDNVTVFGVRIFYDDVPAGNMEVEPATVTAEFVPGAKSALHIHPEQDESYEVLSGTLDLYLNKQWHSLGSGESLSIPRGSVHGFRNSTDEVVRAVNIHNPGLRFLESLQEIEQLIREGKITGLTGLRSGIYMSLHAMKYRREIVTVRPPAMLIRVMAGIGKILGYKLS